MTFYFRRRTLTTANHYDDCNFLLFIANFTVACTRRFVVVYFNFFVILRRKNGTNDLLFDFATQLAVFTSLVFFLFYKIFFHLSVQKFANFFLYSCCFFVPKVVIVAQFVFFAFI